MTFEFKKTVYESIFEWNDSNKGNCFYCKQFNQVEIQLIGQKGICKKCLDSFEIGNVGTDRHVIYQILPEFTNYKKVVEWFENMGIRMVLKDIIDIDGMDTYIYDAINDEKKYNELQNKLKTKEILPFSKDSMYSSNSVEISENGQNIHIIY